MWNKIKALFQKKSKQEPQPLRIEGVEPAPITPVADDAELAAAALLESLAENKATRKSRNQRSSKSHSSSHGNGRVASEKDEAKSQKKVSHKSHPSDLGHQPSKEHYEQLAERVKEGREMEARMTMRLLAYCEQELKNPLLPIGRIVGLERDLLQRTDIVEREGGELKRRWQGCLAEVTVRMMNSVHTENTESAEGANTDDTDGTDI